MRNVGKLMIGAVFVFAALQLLRPNIPAIPATAELQAPPEVKHLFEKNCYSCHSNERRLSWFDQIVPAYWLVRHDILTARRHLNFSTLGAKPKAMQQATLYEAVNMIQLGAMPLPNFVKLHPEAKVSSDELETLKRYLAPWTSAPSQPIATAPAIERSTALTEVSQELNGVPFDAAFENWKPISTTDRGDNYTFRFILGNDVAVKAAQTGNISPWPDGARFAKIAWQQQAGSDGFIHPGKFIQVELMLKNAQQYKDTQGWGWGRWRGADLKPYGKDAKFVNECTGCHQPLAGNDYVYTLPISAAKVSLHEALNKDAATLPQNLPYQPLGWGAVTMYVDPATHTTATLYGNDSAMKAVQTAHTKTPAYRPGSVLALVTWSQREDPHWFGARIPGAPRSIEFVQISDGAQPNQYRRFAGPVLAEERAPANAQRANAILALTPAELP